MAAKSAGLISRFVARRRDLYAEYVQIERVKREAAMVVEELRRRRDGCAPRTLDVPELEAAIRETTSSESAAHVYVCDDCGMDLTPTQEQIDHVLTHGNPLPRPPCPKNANGLHRVAQKQIAGATR